MNLHRAEKLMELCPENPLYHLMQAAVYIRVGKKEEGERILKKYERNHVLQFRNSEFRAGFLYLAGELTDDKIQKKNIVIQLQTPPLEIYILPDIMVLQAKPPLETCKIPWSQ